MLHANLLHEVNEIEHVRAEFHIILVIVRRKSGGHLLKFQQEHRLCLVHFVPRDLTKSRVSSRQQDGILVQMVHQSGELNDTAVVTRRVCRCDYDLACVGDRSNQRWAFFRCTLFGLEAGVVVRHGLLAWLVSLRGVVHFNFLKEKRVTPLFFFFLIFFFFFLPILGANPLHLLKELDDATSEVPERTGLPITGRKRL